MSIGWSIVDKLAHLLCRVQQAASSMTTVALLEAKARAQVGVVHHKLLHMPQHASVYYKQALDIAMDLRPVPAGEAWFRALQDRILEVQNRVRSRRCASL